MGDVDLSSYIIAQGTAEIIEHSTGEPKQVDVLEVGEFTGDIDVLTGRPSIGNADTDKLMDKTSQLRASLET